ncbi:MAG: xanthine dehydrogenase family protein molybdopterin-binding subunit [Rhodospirillaceae bacterium]|nr:xanthine dehydrogenase family protein molybdopterin-binding subunit [Rhodospirillaceae bacterium]MBT6828715.1 xanthine dehydrogenase family protein molybdopterin-binding subunit [Rhodospirillaceae bacterium]
MEADSGTAWIGRSVRRKEDHRLITGKGQYFGDVKAPEALHLVFVRSEHAHARIVSIDIAAAAAMPGIVCVVTGETIRHEIKPLPQPVVVPALEANFPTFWPLAVGKAKFHGEPVAAVVATDKYLAADAAEAVRVTYEPLPYVGDMEAALTPESPIVHEGWESNEIFATTVTGGDTPESEAANVAEVERIFAEAEIVIAQRFRMHRCGVTPLEPRGVMARWDSLDGMTAWITTQRPHIDRIAMSDVLDIPSDKLRVIAPRDQGGAFGVKAPFYREAILVCHLSRKLDATVRWQETRQEHLMAVSQERDQIHDLEIAATTGGKILALRDRGIADNGDGCAGVYWGFVMPFMGAALMPNAYDLPHCDISIRVVTTNKSVLTPARSFGAFPTRFALERAIDMVARRAGMEAAEVRRKNLIQQLPYVTATGLNYDSGNWIGAYDLLLERVDLADFRRRQKAALSDGRYIGIGFGLGAETSGVASDVLVPMENQPGYGTATVRIDPRGKIAIFEGDAPQGQSHETTMAQVAAHEFGILPDDIAVTTGDTATTPLSSGTVGGRAGSYTVSAVANACRVLKEKMARFVAHDFELNASPEDFTFADGEIVYLKDDNIRKSFRDVAERIIMAPINMPPGETGGLEHTAYFEAAMQMFCFSAHAAEVEVDIETGQFEIVRYITSEEVGQVINPQVVEGQIHGGVVQGMSNAMFEQFIYDENGQQLTADFENYKLATAADVPNIEVHHEASEPCPYTPLGSRGLGEGIPAPVPGALTNAVCDALSPFAIEISELPLRPNKIWHLIQDAKANIPLQT